MKKKIFIATVTIAFEAETEGEACDAVSAMFTENLQQEKAIVDWQYTPYNGVYLGPTLFGDVDLGTLEEGEVFKPNTLKVNNSPVF